MNSYDMHVHSIQFHLYDKESCWMSKYVWKLVGWWLKILVNIYFVSSFFFYRVTHQMSELRQNIDKSWGEGHWF